MYLIILLNIIINDDVYCIVMSVLYEDRVLHVVSGST